MFFAGGALFFSWFRGFFFFWFTYSFRLGGRWRVVCLWVCRSCVYALFLGWFLGKSRALMIFWEDMIDTKNFLTVIAGIRKKTRSFFSAIMTVYPWYTSHSPMHISVGTGLLTFFGKLSKRQYAFSGGLPLGMVFEINSLKVLSLESCCHLGSKDLLFSNRFVYLGTGNTGIRGCLWWPVRFVTRRMSLRK